MARRPAAPAGRIAATLSLLAFVALALASGFDRLGLQAPGPGRLVPPALRANSARSAATLALVRQQRGAALAHARAAVAADPVHPASTALLGTARLVDGDLAGAETAFRVAARFGWREPATQLYWYEAALRSGDLPRAAERLDAVLRTRPGFPASEQLLAPVESSAAGRAALIARLRQRPLWLTGYLRTHGQSDAIFARRALVLAELARAGSRLGCLPVAPFVEDALERGARREGERAWLAHCPGASLDGGVVDGGFERFGRAGPSPFGWRAELSGDVGIRAFEKRPGDRALAMRNRSAVSRRVLRQAVSLEPGLYRLTGDVARGRVAASLGCGALPPLPTRVEGDIGAGGQLLRVAPCPRLELGLWLRPGGEEVELDSIRLARVG
ncbi:MAG TPA: hypothetical protein VEB68_08955 [Croceibacterium sp.]|nr:hypothetical protein [Croceibacterium sp.]